MPASDVWSFYRLTGRVQTWRENRHVSRYVDAISIRIRNALYGGYQSGYLALGYQRIALHRTMGN